MYILISATVRAHVNIVVHFSSSMNGIEIKKQPRFNSCCQNGKIQLSLIQQTPKILNSLLDYHGGPISTFFRKKYSYF